MNRFVSALALISFAAPCFSSDLQTSSRFLDSITKEIFEENLRFQSETAALKYFVAVCVRNRKSPSKATRLLKANGYVMFARDKSDGTKFWQSPERKPVFLIQHSNSTIKHCLTFVGKSTSQIRSLEQLLDELTDEDIQRVPKTTIRYADGERGWVLRPGFEHAVYILQDGRNSGITGIILSSLK